MTGWEQATWPVVEPGQGAPTGDNEGLAEAVLASQYEWFDYTPQLQQIRQWAFSLMVNPWAALAVTLTRLSGDLPPNVVLPGFDSSAVASLNFFTVLAGKSGSGKSDMLSSLDTFFCPRPLHGDPVLQTELASGEGIAARLVHTTRDSKTGQLTFHRIAWQIFATTDEIGQIDAVMGREGSTLGSVLRTAWSGGRLGGSTSDVTRLRSVDAHTYRLAWLIGCQPGKGLSLLNDEAQTTGLTQRLLFVPMRDPHLTEDSPLILPPGHLIRPIDFRIPWPSGLGGRMSGDFSLAIRHPIAVDPRIHDELRRERRRLRVTGEGIDGHWSLNRLKVAALLSILHGNHDVSYEWFQAAQAVMDVSDETRVYLQKELSLRSRRQDLSVARREADVEEYKADYVLRSAVADLVSLAKKHQGAGGKHPQGPCTSACIAGITVARRPLWREALAKAEESDLLTVETVLAKNGKESPRWTVFG